MIESTAMLMVPEENLPGTKTQRKLESFKLLPVGWHYGEGNPIPITNVKLANDILYLLYQFGYTSTDAFPGIDNEVRITAYKDNKYLEFTVEDDQTITYLLEISDVEQDYKEGLTIDKLSGIILSIGDEGWNSSDLYTQNIMTTGKADFSPLHLGDPVFQSYAKSASMIPKVQFAITSGSTMKNEYQENPQYSGYLTSDYCLEAIA